MPELTGPDYCRTCHMPVVTVLHYLDDREMVLEEHREGTWRLSTARRPRAYPSSSLPGKPVELRTGKWRWHSCIAGARGS